MTTPTPSIAWHIRLGWNRASYSAACSSPPSSNREVWWRCSTTMSELRPARRWRQADWLLLGVFAGMTLLIMARADVKRDLRTVAVGLLGGLVIEGWGTQTGLWTYYTLERPPLWIIPAWPIASLAIDRLTGFLAAPAARLGRRTTRAPPPPRSVSSPS
jgi:hypothetical protein